MTDVAVLHLAQSAVLLALEISAPVLGLSLVVGLIFSAFQAATQIQEQSLTFIPKLLAMAAALVLFGPWMLQLALTFTRNLLIDMPNFVR